MRHPTAGAAASHCRRMGDAWHKRYWLQELRAGGAVVTPALVKVGQRSTPDPGHVDEGLVDACLPAFVTLSRADWEVLARPARRLYRRSRAQSSDLGAA